MSYPGALGHEVRHTVSEHHPDKEEKMKDSQSSDADEIKGEFCCGKKGAGWIWICAVGGRGDTGL